MLRNIIFNWRSDVCVCVCVRSTFKFSNHYNSQTSWDVKLKSGTSGNPTPSIMTIFICKLMLDLKFYGVSNILENSCGSSNFRKIWAIPLKLHTNIIYRSSTFVIEFGQNWLEHLNFLRFWIFSKFVPSCLTCANFELSSSNFVRECANTKSCFIRNLVRIDRGL